MRTFIFFSRQWSQLRTRFGFRPASTDDEIDTVRGRGAWA